jgi:hypothetical protein
MSRELIHNPNLKTYAEVGNIVNRTPQQIHKMEVDSINKIVDNLSNKYEFDEIIHMLTDMFGVDPEYILKKLKGTNLNLLQAYKDLISGNSISRINSESIVNLRKIGQSGRKRKESSPILKLERIELGIIRKTSTTKLVYVVQLKGRYIGSYLTLSDAQVAKANFLAKWDQDA